MKKKTFLISIILMSAILCFGQMELPFVAYENNPVIEYGDPGSWDEENLLWSFMFVDNDTCYLYYSSSPDIGEEPSSIGLAISTDGYDYLKYTDYPIFEPDGSGFDAWSVSFSVVIYHDGEYKLFYCGQSDPGSVIGPAIGMATADNPKGPWEREENPILEAAGNGDWDSDGITPESVIVTDSGLIMFYSGFKNGYPAMVGLAHFNGDTWIKYDDPTTTALPYAESDPVLKIGPSGDWDDENAALCNVYKMAKGLEMFYTGSHLDNWKTGYATSIDGITWAKHPDNPIYSYEDDPFAMVHGYHVAANATVMIKDDTYFMYYDYGLLGPGYFSLAQADALAEIIRVPVDQPTIQAAIDIATCGDTILVAEGPPYYENINFKGKAIIVASQYLLNPDSNFILNTIIDGSQYTNPDSASVVIFCSGEDTTSILQGFTITGGQGTYCSDWEDYDGGGIFISNAGAKILNNKIIDNIVDNIIGAVGGGICTNLQAEQHWVVIENNYIANNKCLAVDNYASGGGVYVGINGRIINNTIDHNYCYCQNETANAGGFFGSCQPAYTHTIEFSNNTIINNEVEGNYFGGYYSGSGGLTFHTTDAIIRNNIISGNITTSSNEFSLGAGMYFNTPNNYFHIINNTISDNYSNSELHGGGIYLYNTGTKEILIDGNLIYNNQATIGGGIYAKASYNVILTNNVFTGNMVEGNGGALAFKYTLDDHVTMLNNRSLSANKLENSVNLDNQNPNIINNTFYNNSANNFGGALYSNYSLIPVVVNSIFWENEAEVGPDIYNTSATDIPVYYSDIDTSLIYGNWQGENNIKSDPLFIDDSCHVDQASECLESGVMSIVINDQTFVCPDHDFDNEVRPFNATADIGADEVLITSISEIPIEGNDQTLQNFPNPFSGSTSILFELKSDCFADLSIYDLTGKKVQTILSDHLQKGKHKIEFDAERLLNGIYFYQLKTDNNIAGTRKMIVLN